MYKSSGHHYLCKKKKNLKKKNTVCLPSLFSFFPEEADSLETLKADFSTL